MIIKKAIIKEILEGEMYQLEGELVLYIKGKNYVVPRGYLSDLVTVPTFLDFYFNNKQRNYIWASLIHDYALEFGQIEVMDVGFIQLTRKQADKLFYDALVSLGFCPYGSYVVYLAVRCYSKLVESGIRIKL